MSEPISSVSPLTGRQCRELFRHEVIGRFDAQYFLDESIGYIFVANPIWLEEAYSNAIAVTDTGILERNQRNVDVVSKAILRERHPFTKGVDLGGGYGIFVRAMRDAGFDFYWTDKYAENLLARGFEAERGNHSTAVAFEVLEHLENPLAFLKAAQDEFGFDTCFFSASCFDERNIPGEDWWYWSFETGQHISFFSQRALHWLAGQMGMRLWHLKDDVFAFSSLSWSGDGYEQSCEALEPLGKTARARALAQEPPSPKISHFSRPPLTEGPASPRFRQPPDSGQLPTGARATRRQA